jgi:hypothetical protein
VLEAQRFLAELLPALPLRLRSKEGGWMWGEQPGIKMSLGYHKIIWPGIYFTIFFLYPKKLGIIIMIYR